MTYWVEPKQKTPSVTTSQTTATCTTATTAATRSGSMSMSTHTSITEEDISSDSPSSSNIHSSSRVSSSQRERLINWNIDVLERLLKKIVSRRAALGEKGGSGSSDAAANWNRPHGTIVLNEVKEVIKLPEYNSKYTDTQEDPDSIILDSSVRIQLREF